MSHKNISRRVVLAASVTALALALSACHSKKKVKDDAALADQNGPQIENTPMNFNPQGSDSGQIAGLQTVTFDYDKSSISAAAKEKIKGNADWMKSHGNINVQIEGHCDARGSIEYNLALGERRARAVKDYMVSLGIPESRLNVISYGKEKPIDASESDAAYAKNRRANFVPIAQ